MKRILKSFILSFFVILIFLISNKSNATEYLSDKSETVYNNLSGLATGKANTITQTENGYIWIGQYAGLTKYNSKTFEKYSKIQNYDLSSVVELEAKGNVLLIGTEHSFYTFDTSSNEIEQYKFGNIDDFSVNDISIYKDNCYVATTSGLYHIDLSTKEYKKIVDYQVSKVSTYKDRTYFIFNKKLYSIKDINNPVSSFIDVNSTAVYVNEDLYVGSDRGFFVNEASNFVRTNDASFNINSFLIDNKILYLACDNGLYLYDLVLKTLTIVNQLNVTNSLEKIIKDYEGNIWLASSKQGVSKITQNKLLDYFFEYSISQMYGPNISVNSFVRYKGLDYIATDTGLIAINEELDTSYAVDENQLVELCRGIRIRALSVFNNKLYVATYNSSEYDLIEYDGEYIVNHNLADYTSFDSNASDIRCLTVVNDELIIGTKKEILRFDGNNFVSKTLESAPLYITNSNDKLYICEDNIGVVVLDLNFDSTSEEERIDKNNKYSILKTLIIDDKILFNSNDTLYYYADGKIVKLNHQFEGSIIELVHVDDKYIVGTDNTIYIYNDLFSDETPTKLDLSDGLKGSLVANSNGYYDSVKKQYYFTANNGIYVYNLEQKLVSNTSYKICVNNISTDLNAYNTNDSITISNKTKRLTISFDVLAFGVDPKYEVWYRLDGVDSDFRILTEKDVNEISYTNLAGGEYKFEIFVKNGNNIGELKTISINKPKKLYEHNAFWIVLAIVVITFLILVNILYIKHKTKKMIQRQNEYKEITLESIEAIARTIDAKDHYTNGHSLRVGFYAREIAKEMGFKQQDVENIYYAALLHDIGKIAVPDKILNKPGHLSDDEYVVIQTHTVEGAKILSSISTIPNITYGAKYHHEKYDGSGYPDGLKGDEIPLVARIICCADCYDAMATKRVYKEPYLTNKIIEEFVKCSGTQFDPEIAKVVIKLINENKINAYVDTSIEAVREDNKNNVRNKFRKKKK